MINPLDYSYNWIAILVGFGGTIAGYLHGKFPWWTSLKSKVSSLMTSQKTKDIASLKAELADLKSKIVPPAV